AGAWQNWGADEGMVREGDMAARFYVLVAGKCAVERYGLVLGRLGTGDCFGESSYVPGARRAATVRATTSVTLLKVGATLLEQASANCQLRFNRVFLRALIERLQKAEDTAEVQTLNARRMAAAAHPPLARVGARARSAPNATQPTGTSSRRRGTLPPPFDHRGATRLGWRHTEVSSLEGLGGAHAQSRLAVCRPGHRVRHRFRPPVAGAAGRAAAHRRPARPARAATGGRAAPARRCFGGEDDGRGTSRR